MCHLEFNVRFQTNGRQKVVSVVKASRKEYVCILNTCNSNDWSGTLDVDLPQGNSFSYHYEVREDNQVAFSETVCPCRSIEVGKSDENISLYDIWRYDIRQINYESSAFTQCLFPFVPGKAAAENEGCCVFTVNALTPASRDLRVMLVGNSKETGDWNPMQGIPMQRVSRYEYKAMLTGVPANFQYKYVVIDNDETMWENGSNRTLNAPEADDYTKRANDGWIRMPRYSDWYGAGIVVPLFSLHSKASAGIGDFADLKRFVGWAANVGLSVVQLLPINDTTVNGTWRDSYPYSIISAFALHPIYISLREAGYSGKYPADINESETVDYERTYCYKIKALRGLYRKVKPTLKSNARYAKFKETQAFWLDSYSEFCAKRDGFVAEFYKYIQFVAFTQMKGVRDYARSMHVVLKGDIPIGVNVAGSEIAAHPELFNIDMSTGAPPDSFSAEGQNWGFPTYNWPQMSKDGFAWWKKRMKSMALFFDAYRLDHVLGFFRIWEIPRIYSSAAFGHFSPAIPYSADEISDFGFEFREEYIGNLFLRDIKDRSRFHPAINATNTKQFQSLDNAQKQSYYRLQQDFFQRRNEQLWEREGSEKLKAITKATKMLPCAEDLGMISQCVGKVLDKYGILSLEIQLMPKRFGVEFADMNENPYNSVATPATHDMPPMRKWWNMNEDVARRYNQTVLQRDVFTKEATADVCCQIVQQHLASQSMLCLISFQDWTSISGGVRADNRVDEQINNPADCNQYWRYKTHLSIEDLENEKEFASLVRNLVHASSRDLFL